MVQVEEAGNTWKLCSIEDKPRMVEPLQQQVEEVEEPLKQVAENQVSVTSRKGNAVKSVEKQFGQQDDVGRNESMGDGSAKTNQSSNTSQGSEMVIEEENLVRSLTKEALTRKTVIASRKVEPMVSVELLREDSMTGGKDGKIGEESDQYHAEEPRVESNQEKDIVKVETKETTPTKRSGIRPGVTNDGKISVKPTSATKVTESKVKSMVNDAETTIYKEISTIYQNNETKATSFPALSDPKPESNELRIQLHETEPSKGRTGKGEASTSPTDKISNLMETTRVPVERVSVPANSSLATSNTPGSRLKPNIESTTSSYSIKPPSSSQFEEKQLYPKRTKPTQSPVSTDLAKFPSAAEQKEGIASKDNFAISGKQGKDKVGERKSVEVNVDKSENNSRSKTDFSRDPTPHLNSKEFDRSSDNNTSEIEMTEVVLEEPLDSVDLKQVMKAVLQEAKENLRQKRGVGPASRSGRSGRGRKWRRKAGSTAPRFVAGRSGRDRNCSIVCMLSPHCTSA